MTEIIDRLAKEIYTAEVTLAIESGFDSPYYKQVPIENSNNLQASAVEIIAYEDLPQHTKDAYFEMAQAILKPLREKMLTDNSNERNNLAYDYVVREDKT